MGKKRSVSRPKIRKHDACLHKDVLEAIERIWPEGVVEMSFDSAESYFWDILPALWRALNQIKGASFLFDREAEGEPIWSEEADHDEDPPYDFTCSRSYHLFFVSPEGVAFRFDTEIEDIIEEEMDEEIEESGCMDPPMKSIPGIGRTGWSIAVSLLAPFAVVSLNDMVVFEDGSTSEPAIKSCVQAEEGELITDLEAQFRKFHGKQAFEILDTLRGEILGILERHGLKILHKEEWCKPIPWLRGDDEVIAGLSGEPIRVLDAFLFEGL